MSAHKITTTTDVEKQPLHQDDNNISTELREFLKKIECVHRSAGIGNGSFATRKSEELENKLSDAAKSELKEWRRKNYHPMIFASIYS